MIWQNKDSISLSGEEKYKKFMQLYSSLLKRRGKILTDDVVACFEKNKENIVLVLDKYLMEVNVLINIFGYRDSEQTLQQKIDHLMREIAKFTPEQCRSFSITDCYAFETLKLRIEKPNADIAKTDDKIFDEFHNSYNTYLNGWSHRTMTEDLKDDFDKTIESNRENILKLRREFGMRNNVLIDILVRAENGCHLQEKINYLMRNISQSFCDFRVDKRSEYEHLQFTRQDFNMKNIHQGGKSGANNAKLSRKKVSRENEAWPADQPINPGSEYEHLQFTQQDFNMKNIYQGGRDKRKNGDDDAELSRKKVSRENEAGPADQPINSGVDDSDLMEDLTEYEQMLYSYENCQKELDLLHFLFDDLDTDPLPDSLDNLPDSACIPQSEFNLQKESLVGKQH